MRNLKKFEYRTEHRAYQAICRLFDKGYINSLDADVNETNGKFTINTGKKYDFANAFTLK